MASNKTTTSIGDRIKELREQRDLTQAELAGKLYISREKVNMWENGSRMIKGDDIAKLADILDTTCDYILRGVSSENISIHKATGLSENAIKKLRQLYNDTDGRIPESVAIRKTLVNLISILIESDECVSLFKEIGLYLSDAVALRPVEDNNLWVEPEEYKRVERYIEASGKTIAFKSDICDLHMENARKSLTRVYSRIAEEEKKHKEDEIHGKH